MIAVIDYDAGNIRSVIKALEFLGEECVLTRDENILLSADGVILPGVGAFGEAMKKLEEYNLVSPIKKIVDLGIPFMGICLGLQLMFDESEESPGVKGLSLLSGKIKKFPEEDGIKIPHMGWNSLSFPKETRLFAGLQEEPYTYFVHSFYLDATDKNITAANCTYGSTTFDAAVEDNNIFACQFHPEKSSENGLKILTNFINITKEGK